MRKYPTVIPSCRPHFTFLLVRISLRSLSSSMSRFSPFRLPLRLCTYHLSCNPLSLRAFRYLCVKSRSFSSSTSHTPFSSTMPLFSSPPIPPSRLSCPSLPSPTSIQKPLSLFLLPHQHSGKTLLIHIHPFTTLPQLPASFQANPPLGPPNIYTSTHILV